MKRNLFILASAMLLLSSCGSSKSVISESIELSKYKYATLNGISNYGSSEKFMGTEIKMYDAVANTRLEVLGDARLGELTPSQKEQLLNVQFSATQSGNEAVVVANCLDYQTGRPVAVFRGTSKTQLKVINSKPLNGAVKKVAKQFEQNFPK